MRQAVLFDDNNSQEVLGWISEVALNRPQLVSPCELELNLAVLVPEFDVPPETIDSYESEDSWTPHGC